MKVNFNDLLKEDGVDAVLARVSEQVLRLVTSSLPPREINQEKAKSWGLSSPQSLKSNPFKTNPLDVKSCTSDDFGRGR